MKLEAIMNFSLRLKELREQKGKSQAQLANEIGVSLGCVGMWESTQQVPPANYRKIRRKILTCFICIN